MGISYIEMNEQKIPIEDEELRERVATMQNEVDMLNRTVGYTVGKNYLPNKNYSCSEKGVTIVVNNDKSVTLNGTNTNVAKLMINLVSEGWSGIYKEIDGLEDGVEYTISGCASGGDTLTYCLSAICMRKDGTTYSFDDIGNSNTFIHEKGNKYRIYIGVTSGTSLNNLTFYPMIRKSTDNETYEPYIDSVKDNTDGIGEIIVDETISMTVSASTLTTIKTYKNLTKGTYIATLRVIGGANSLVSGQIYKNANEIEASTGNTYTGVANGNSAQTNLTSMFSINNTADEIKFCMYSSVALTDRSGQKIKIMKIS